MNPTRAASVSIDLAALQHNFQRVKAIRPNSAIMPVIKANAYGHGMVQVARALSQAEAFAVAQLDEALYLRAQGIQQPVTVFQGFANAQQLEQMIELRLRPAISQLWQLDLLAGIQASSPLDVWLKLDTGMGRLGIQPHQLAACAQQLSRLSGVREWGLMMHFANADQPEHPANQQQIQCFQALLRQLPGRPISVSSSAAIMADLYPSEDWLRPGIMLYGASPLQHLSAAELDLRPVMSLQASLIAINQLATGHGVGYGGGWVCPEAMPVGIVNIGYGDGYPRHAPSGTPVAVNGQLTQLIGRVSMDSIAIDLRGIDASCGDRVELWGSTVPVDEVAARAETIAYELLCNAGRLIS